MAMVPMEGHVALKTVQDHSCLLESVENKAALAYYAIYHRNQSLYEGIRTFCFTP